MSRVGVVGVVLGTCLVSCSFLLTFIAGLGYAYDAYLWYLFMPSLAVMVLCFLNYVLFENFIQGVDE